MHHLYGVCMKKTVVLATRNAGKIRELAGELEAFGLEVLGLEAFPDLEDVEETGLTFEANALLKAQTVAQSLGLIAVADDSGLEVDALNKAPGIYSARYANDIPALPNENKDERNMRKLLLALDNISQRSARFVCCMAACKPNGKHIVVRGTWEGSIARQARGAQGFGYDPVFFDQDLKRTAAELSKEEKLARSHRGNALKKLLAKWEDFYTDE